jgi:glycosyltransferase involved in cell wall biosynthesis
MSANASFTVLIAARNAEATIARAVASVRDEAVQIILIDDRSADATVAKAREAAGPHLRLLTRSHHGPLGATRQAALAHITTPFAAWLDADDEYLPGRIQRLAATLDDGADIAADTTILVDGGTGFRLGDAPLPAWTSHTGAPARLFERNTLPAIGLVAFRTARWRALGYDPMLHGAEDVDIVLRAIMAGAPFGWIPEAGTRVHIYETSLSRNRENQRQMYGRALRKHSYDSICDLYQRSGWDACVTRWALASIAMFQDDPRMALGFLSQLEEVEGVTWRLAFLRGTALLLSGDPRAIDALAEAEALRRAPEAANNLGVALSRNGRPVEAQEAFASSLERFPGYQDARINLVSAWPSRITTHPLREQYAA